MSSSAGSDALVHFTGENFAEKVVTQISVLFVWLWFYDLMFYGSRQNKCH